jgi:hypothetical protein
MKYLEVIGPIFFSVAMAIARTFKAGRTKIVNIITETVFAFTVGWLGYYILTEWYFVNYNIVCGVCGFLGYLSPHLLQGGETFVKNFITNYNKNQNHGS